MTEYVCGIRDEPLDRAVGRLAEYPQQAETETDENGQTGIEGRVALAQIERVSESVRERADTSEEREEQPRERFAEMAD